MAWWTGCTGSKRPSGSATAPFRPFRACPPRRSRRRRAGSRWSAGPSAPIHYWYWTSGYVYRDRDRRRDRREGEPERGNGERGRGARPRDPCALQGAQARRERCGEWGVPDRGARRAGRVHGPRGGDHAGPDAIRRVRAGSAGQPGARGARGGPAGRPPRAGARGRRGGGGAGGGAGACGGRPRGQVRETAMRDGTIERAIADIRAGKLVIVADDEDRENEGDLVGAAEQVTPEMINFMATHGRGLICLTLTPERCQALGLSQMAEHNTESRETAFTVSIDAAPRFGVTTGISAADRAATMRVAIDPAATPGDLRRPGHVFPLRARPGGVLQRVGQTEASIDLARLAGLYPAGVICEILNPDGTMARRPDGERFAARHALTFITVAQH